MKTKFYEIKYYPLYNQEPYTVIIYQKDWKNEYDEVINSCHFKTYQEAEEFVIMEKLSE